jgi:hypothetical protein
MVGHDRVFSLLYRVTLGRKLDDALIIKSMNIIDPAIHHVMKQGKPQGLRSFVCLLRFLTIVSLPGFEYGWTHRYRLYVNKTLLDPTATKGRERLLKKARKHLLTDDYIVITEFFQYVFFQHCIQKEKDKALSLLYSILALYVPLDAARYTSAEVFHQMVHYPTFSDMGSLKGVMIVASTGLVERLVKQYRPRFDVINEYILQPSESTFESMFKLFERYYVPRRAQAFRALMEVAGWLNQEEHATRLKAHLLEMDSELPVVLDLKKAQSMMG